MTDWIAIIDEALKELGADAVFTRGAILHSRVRQIAKRSGLDFDGYLKETDEKFSSVVQKVEGIEIHKPPNTDMFVGLAGAKWPESTRGWMSSNRQRFRADVYEAFTRISDVDYCYLPDTDEFRRDVAEGDARKTIPVPSVTLDGLLTDRRRFAEESAAPEELGNAIQRSPNPLAAFQAEIARLRLGQEWHIYQSKILRERIEDWSKQNGFEFSTRWMESPSMELPQHSPQQLLATFAVYMTDEEVRSISVPFRAVEAMYRHIGGSKR